MKGKFSLLLLAFLGTFSMYSQSIPTWSEDVAAIIYTKCVHCHHENAIAPFSLTTYDDVANLGESFHHVIEENKMPPWPADPNFRHFANEFYLTDQEKETLLDWYHNYMPVGDINTAPLVPEFDEGGSLLDTIDFVVAIEPYTLTSNNDVYRWFVIENEFTETIYINKIEVFAGAKEIVHHADISYDITGNSLANDLADPLPGFGWQTGSPTISYYMNAWQPGGNIATYPEGWGIAVPPNADFVIEIHYGPGGIFQTDSTYMNLEFVKETDNVRAVNVGWLLNQSSNILIDGPLVIPANTEQTFHQQTTVNFDMSLISICPHMHYLGKSYKVWAVTPDNEFIPLIDIPQWDFHWQRYYTFPQVQYLPAGTELFSEGVYDNTVNNHDNPNNPPINVYAGSLTTDEMFLCYFIYAQYQNGDENISMVDTFILETPVVDLADNFDHNNFTVYPVPADEQVNINFNSLNVNSFSIEVYNVDGVQMFKKKIGQENAVKIPTVEFSNGCYIYKLVDNNEIITKGNFIVSR